MYSEERSHLFLSGMLNIANSILFIISITTILIFPGSLIIESIKNGKLINIMAFFNDNALNITSTIGYCLAVFTIAIMVFLIIVRIVVPTELVLLTLSGIVTHIISEFGQRLIPYINTDTPEYVVYIFVAYAMAILCLPKVLSCGYKLYN